PKALCADVDENALWSLQFENVSISEALEKIKQTTGIKIVRPSRLGRQLITRSYNNKTIEYILKDIFRDMNYALVWSHGEKGITSVRILALDRVGGTGATQSSDEVRPGIREYPAPGYPARRQAPQRRGPSPPTRSVEESEPEEADSEISTEQEQEEEERAEGESKEEDKEELSSSGDSDEEAEKGSEESPSPAGQNKEEESESSSPGEEEPTGER
ncbi:MAG: hypothetical protein PVH82_16790, partial [Desulfobacteraceae bacterium]